ncbi:hypothetical protein AJ80_03883 [Polytolypa hystricis UAMH7299]|uniref:Golgi apyrase n=1 Tax=Polytolypa hystricis (strain UAMH7299) TaxID=1447883 RepID=A0A2B7YG14_POLH7|nr:hypothetical protein AJ80_03883 [Polytolypa hystricis UAMH7299]
MVPWRYAVILDAGSSGTRVHVYRWPDSAAAREAGRRKVLKSLPAIKTKSSWSKKIKPGVSSFSKAPENVGADHLKPLLDHALDIVPQDHVADTPIFVLATAGMRLLPDSEQKAILKKVCSHIQETTHFLLPDCDSHVQVIDGKTEGLYGWTATNYLLGSFDAPQLHDHGKDHHTYGFLDMGGASSQIAFAPNATEAQKHADDLTLLRLRKVNGRTAEHKVFVTSWLGFGVHEARNRYVKALLETSGSLDTGKHEDPCLPAGLKMAVDGTMLEADSAVAVNDPYLVGTGKFDQCLLKTYPLLEKDAPCEDEPCLIHGVHVPAIDFDVNHFVGISGFWHTTHEIFASAHKDEAYDHTTYQERVKEFCSLKWSDMQAGVLTSKWGKKVDEKTAYEVCFKASWLINILHDGIGVPRIDIDTMNGPGYNGTKAVSTNEKPEGYLDAFQAVDKIDATEVSWTLGKAVLYSSSQVRPARDDDLPVGFGSNVPGVPDDFQYPGPKLPPIPHLEVIESGNTTTTDDHWHDTLFNGDTPRRIPGVFLFLLIVLIALFFLCGRERRSRIYRRLYLSSHRGGGAYRKRPLFGGKLPFFGHRNTVAYERVLEEGAPDFELDGFASEDDLSPKAARFPSSSSSSSSRSSQGLKYGFDNGSSQSVGLGIGGHAALDRAGLVVRTESREQLVPPALNPTFNGRRSRTSSPVRHKAPKTSGFSND